MAMYNTLSQELRQTLTEFINAINAARSAGLELEFDMDGYVGPDTLSKLKITDITLTTKF